MSQVEFEGRTELQQFIRFLPEFLFEGARDVFRQTVFAVQGRVLARLQGTPMQSRTGALARSMLTDVSGSEIATLTASVYSAGSGDKGIAYARIHEFGGVIEAKNAYRWLPGGPYLNIPTTANMTAAGVQRMTPAQVFAAGGKVMSPPKTTTTSLTTGAGGGSITTRTSGGLGVYLDGEKMFSFAKRVTIKPQLGLRDSAEAEVVPMLKRFGALLLKDV